ncbi:anti-sigma-D factor RsdA, partial [Tsukamurella ocularis]|uniref:anti-sigma-D factor RsdA n=1 Tax=Tsukamurella ocularis TaxID=1970234 RepID=UPI0039EE5A80
MADDNDERGENRGRFDPHDPERTAAHRLGPPIRPMRPGAPRDLGSDDTGFIDRVTDDGAPVDVAAVRRDDDLIEALAAGGAVTTADQTEFALASLLADWRDEIVTTPVPAGPSVDELVAASGAGRRTRGFRP